MLISGARLALQSRRRKRLEPMAALSLALHLGSLAAVVMLVPAPPLQIGTPGPPAVEVVADASAAPEKLPTPTTAPDPPMPTPPAEVPPPPPVPQTQIPPPPPPPPPDQTDLAALPPPPPAPPTPVAPPTPAPPQHVAARPAPRAPARPKVSAAATPAHATAGQALASRGSGGSPDNGWIAKLKQWWDEHAVYPADASVSNQGGDVKVHMVIAADGEVTSIEVVRSSGSRTLDMAALAVFRNARLPPAAPGTPTPPGDVEVSLHYIPAGSGG